MQNGDFQNAKKDEEVYENKDKLVTVIRNSINYKTFTTDGDSFAPYGVDEYLLNEKDIFFLLNDKQFKKDELKEVLKLISEIGYGKDTTIGKGRFYFEDFKEISIDFNSTTYMSLSPFSIDNKEEIEKLFYEPFVRFGKLGGDRAYKNAFKKPILFLNTASTIIYKEKKERFFAGCAIENISTYKDVVHQGYTILLPIKDIQ